MTELLENIISEVKNSFSAPSVAVCVSADGKLYSASTGCSENTVFQIGEISKTFLCRAIESSGLDPDKPVREYSPWFSVGDEYLTDRITIRDIALQRTGIPPHETSWFIDPTASYADTAEKLKAFRPVHGFRERFCRQDHLFAAASRVLEDASGTDWESFVKSELLDMYGLGTTFTTLSSLESSGYSDIARPHYLRYRRPVEGSRWITDPLAGGGSMLSCVDDLCRWTELTADREQTEWIQLGAGDHFDYPLSAVGISEAWYAGGWFRMRFLGRDLYCSYGNTGGFSIFTGKLKGESGLSFAAAADLNDCPAPQAIGYALCEHAIRGVTSDWNTRMAEIAAALDENRRIQNSRLLRSCTDDVFSASCAGTYHNEGYGDLYFFEEYGRLFLELFGIPMRVYRTDTENCVLDATEVLGTAVPCAVDDGKIGIMFESDGGCMTEFRKI